MKTKKIFLFMLAILLIFAGCAKEMTDEEILERAEEIKAEQETSSTSPPLQEDDSSNFCKAFGLNDEMDLLNGIDNIYYDFIDNISGIVVGVEGEPDFIQITIFCEELNQDELYDLAFNNLSEVVGEEGEPIDDNPIGITEIEPMDNGNGSFITYGLISDSLPEFKTPFDYYTMIEDEIPQKLDNDYIDMIAVGFNDEFPELTFLLSYFGADMDTYIEYVDGFSSFDNYNYDEEEFSATANTPSGYSLTSIIDGSMRHIFLSQNPIQTHSENNDDMDNDYDNENDNNCHSDPSAWADFELDNTPIYFDNRFSDLQNITLDEFAAGYDKENYDFISEYIIGACIFMPQPPIDEPEDDDEWTFYEFYLDNISLEDAVNLFENAFSIKMEQEEDSYGYEYEGHVYGLYYDEDFDGNTILNYTTITKGKYLPNVKKLDDYNEIIDIPLPLSDDAYLQGLMLNYNVAAKDVEVMYEYALLNGKSEEIIENYIDTVSQIEGGVNSNNVLSSVVRNGVHLRVYFDNQRYSDMDMLRIEVTPLPISVFTCGFEEEFNKNLESTPAPKIVTDIFDIAKQSFTDCDTEMNYTGDNMCFTINSDTYNGNLFHEEVFEYLEMEGEPEGDNGGFWYNFEDYRVSAYINGKDIRVDITGSTDDLLDYGKAAYADYPYHLMPELPNNMYDINISYPVLVDYNFDKQAFSYTQSNEFLIYFDINGIIDESEIADYLSYAYPARYEEMSELSIKGVPASYNIEYRENNEKTTHVEICFYNHNILERYHDQD